MKDSTCLPDDAAWYSRYFRGEAGKQRNRVSFQSLQLYEMSVELRKTIRVVCLKDVSDAPADYYL